ncbi:TPA: hypothetical protein ACJG67_004915 [Salmonella enterica subsp. enterica serovar Kottbus]
MSMRNAVAGALAALLLAGVVPDGRAGGKDRAQEALNSRLARELQTEARRVSEGGVADVAARQARRHERLRLQLEMDRLRVQMAATPDAQQRRALEAQMAPLKRAWQRAG